MPFPCIPELCLSIQPPKIAVQPRNSTIRAILLYAFLHPLLLFTMRSPRKRLRCSQTTSLASTAPRFALAKSRPLFSWSYELLFPQVPYFDNLPHCPGVWGSTLFLATRHSPLATFPVPKSFIIRSYEKCACNPFRIRSYKNTGGGYPPHVTRLDVPTFRCAFCILNASTQPSNVPPIDATWTRTAHPMNNAPSSRAQVHG